MEEVSLGEGVVLGEERRLERRREAPRGGLKMSRPRSSWLMPRTVAARWAAAGLRKQSLPRTVPGEEERGGRGGGGGGGRREEEEGKERRGREVGEMNTQ